MMLTETEIQEAHAYAEEATAIALAAKETDNAGGGYYMHQFESYLMAKLSEDFNVE